MLGYLVTSSTRRRLLELLWGRRAQGTVGALATAAGLSYAGAYRELQHMVRHGLAARTIQDGDDHYAAALGHADAEVLQRLLATPVRRVPPAASDATTRGQLRALGAPLPDAQVAVPDGDLEAVLVAGVELARRDATIARVLPIVFWRVHEALDRERLEAVARARHQKQAVGFVLALAGRLGRDRRMTRWSAQLRDRRVSALRPFFEVPSTRAAERTAERRTPELARRWGFSMSLQLEDFQAQFDMFARAQDGQP